MKYFLCVLILVFVSIQISAYDGYDNGIYYDIVNGEAIVTHRFNISQDEDPWENEGAYSGDVVIPSTITYWYDKKTYPVTAIGRQAFISCSDVTSVVIPNSITRIEGGAFQECDQLSSITIPNSVTYIGGQAFYECRNLESVIIPNSVTTIDINAFWVCTGLKKVEFESIESLCKISFRSPSSNPLNYAHHLYIEGKEVNDLLISSSVTSIGSYAFYGCSGLTSINIPSSVTSIGDYAFYNCSKDIDVYNYATTPLALSNQIFNNFGRLHVKSGCMAAYQEAYGWKDFSIAEDFISITVNSADDSKGSVIGGGEFKEGDEVTITAIPQNGYCFSRWSDGSTSNPYKFQVTESKSLTAEFAIGGYCKNLSVRWTYEDGVLNIIGSGSMGIYSTAAELPWHKYRSMIKEVNISEGITEIPNHAFNNCKKITSINIPNSVTSIGYNAFEYCTGLTTIHFPDQITGISIEAFSGCTGLTSVVIPDNVSSIGSSAFSGCLNLITVTVGKSVKSIGAGAFYGCTKLFEVYNLSSLNIEKGSSSYGYVASNARAVHNSLDAPSVYYQIDEFIFIDDSPILVAYEGTDENISLPSDCNGKSYSVYQYAFYANPIIRSVFIPSKVESIGYYAFKECSNLTNVIISEGIDGIRSETFYNTNLSSITIPSSVTFIGVDAIRCNSLSSIVCYAREAPVYGYDDITNNTECIVHVLPGCAESYRNTIGWKKLNIVEDAVDPNPKTIASGTCGKNGDNLTWTLTDDGNLTIDGTGEMEDYPSPPYTPWYSNNEDIKTVTINDNVTTIGNHTFSDCSSLTSVVIGNSVTTIGECAFYECAGLTSISIPNSVISIGRFAFYRCTSLTSVTIPNSVTTIGNFVFWGCTGLTSVIIGNSVTSISKSAFDGCFGLTSVIIGNSVTNICENAFKDCYGLKSVTIPNSVTSIGNSAFEHCPDLTSITIPNSVTSIGDRTFSGCSGLTSTTIPNSVTHIGDRAFAYCTGLTSINVDEANGNYCSIDGVLFNKNITSLIQYPANKTDVTQYAIPNSVTSICEESFSGCSGLTSITIPNSVTQIGDGAFSGFNGLTSITIPNSVTSIGNSAFTYCRSLTSITIPNSVTSIGEHAFEGCTSLTSITIPNSVTSIGERAFAYCTSLTSITIPNSVTSIKSGTFEECSNLSSVTIPNSVTTIGGFTFAYCDGLTDITIPNSVTSIGGCAFWNCKALESLTCLAKKVPTLGYNDLYTNPSLTIHVRLGYGDAYRSTNNWNYFTIVEDAIDPTLRTITLGTSNYATYCSDANLDFSEVEGLKAYIASSFSPTTGALIITRVDNVPAGVGVLVKGTSGERYDVPLTDEANVVANLMAGTTTATTLYPTDGDYTNFVLSKNNEGVMGFYRFSGSASMPANKAWLKIPTYALGVTPAKVKSFRFVEEGDEMTGVSIVEEKAEDSNSTYDLQGRKLYSQPARGIYIRNGKKFIK